MEELLEFLREKCVKGLREAKGKCVERKLIEEIESIERVLGELKISSSPDIKMKDTLYDLISALTDIIISHSQNRPAQIICSPLQIGSRRRTRNRLRTIRTALEGVLGYSSPHGKEEDGRLGTCSPIRKIMTTLKRLLPQGTKNNSPKGEDDAGPEPHGERTNDRSSNEKKYECSGPETLPEIDRKSILGFDKKLDEIELCLNDQNRGGHIEIGIVGMYGSGKTTLAQLVYGRDSVVKEFAPRIWVNLPHQLTSNDTYFEQILGVILRQCDQDKVDQAQCGNGKQQLLRIIRNRLLGKSYILVLDGVWDADMDWYFELGRALDWHYKGGDVGNDGSKSAVIITTRLEEVAKTMVGISALHHIHPYLTPDICWDIFIYQVEQGGKIKRNSASLEKWENDIKEQCDGLPLAAVTLAKIIPKLICEAQQREQGAAAQAESSVP